MHTLATLCWLQLYRCRPGFAGALLVCPTPTFASADRRCTMVLQKSDHQSCDGQPIHPYASKMPQIKNIEGKGSLLNMSKMRHSAMVHMVDKLLKYLDMIMRVHDVVFSEEFEIPKNGLDMTMEKWDGACKTLAKIPTGWMANWLLKKGAPHGLTRETLEALAADPILIPELFSYVVQCPLKTDVPPGLVENPMLMSDLLSKRATDCGDRLGPFIKRGGVRGGVLNFAGACFELTFGETKATHVKHVNSGKTVELASMPHIVITTEFDMHDSHLDGHARVTLGFTTVELWRLFDSQEPFISQIIKDKKGKKLLDLSAEMCKAELARKEAMAAACTIDKSILAKAAADRKAKGTDKAREAAARKRQERGEKRKIKLVST